MPEILDITFIAKGKISFETRPLILKYSWIIEKSGKVPSIQNKKILNRASGIFEQNSIRIGCVTVRFYDFAAKYIPCQNTLANT